MDSRLLDFEDIDSKSVIYLLSKYVCKIGSSFLPLDPILIILDPHAEICIVDRTGDIPIHLVTEYILQF